MFQIINIIHFFEKHVVYIKINNGCQNIHFFFIFILPDGNTFLIELKTTEKKKKKK